MINFCDVPAGFRRDLWASKDKAKGLNNYIKWGFSKSNKDLIKQTILFVLECVFASVSFILELWWHLMQGEPCLSFGLQTLAASKAAVENGWLAIPKSEQQMEADHNRDAIFTVHLHSGGSLSLKYYAGTTVGLRCWSTAHLCAGVTPQLTSR